MAITSADIQNQSFAIDRKGYMVDEVDDFLERVADEIDELNNTVADLQRQLEDAGDAFAGFDTPVANEEEPVVASYADTADLEEELAQKDAEIQELKAQLSDQRADTSAIAQALIVAQRSADEVLADAKARAAEIIADAQSKANEIIEDAEADRAKIEDAISALEEERATVRSNYQEALRNFIDDATAKLSALDKDARGSAHARVAEPVVRSVVPTQAQVPVRQETASEPVYVAPAQANQPVVAAATVVPSSMEKDFSGFGDTDDDFGFDDID